MSLANDYNIGKVGDLVEAAFKKMGIYEKFREHIIISSWEGIMGKTIAQATDSLNIKNNVLFVKMNSSVVKNELLMLKTNIIDVINKKFGEPKIVDIVIK